MIDVEDDSRLSGRRWLFLVVMVLLIVVMLALEHRFYTPGRSEREARRVNPATQDLAFNPYRVAVENGQSISVWYVPYRKRVEPPEDFDPFFYSPRYDTQAREPGSTILILGDGKRSKRSALPQTRMFHRVGHHVFLFDYRGTGRSPGSATLEGFLEDSLLMAGRICRRRKGDRIALYGLGVGANLALEVACRLQEEAPDALKALVLDTPIESLEECHRQLLERKYGRWLASLLAWRRPCAAEIRDATTALEELAALPVFWLHSQGDAAPARATARLCALTQGPKDFWLVPQSFPGEGAEEFPLETADQLAQFLDPFLLLQGSRRGLLEAEIRPGEDKKPLLRFTASRQMLQERRRLPVEVYVLTDQGLYTERRWVDRDAPVLAYRLEQPPLLSLAKVFRFVEPASAETSGQPPPTFVLSCCQTEREYYDRLQARQSAQTGE